MGEKSEGIEGNVDQTIDQTYSDNSDWSGLWTYRGTNKVKKSYLDFRQTPPPGFSFRLVSV